MVHVKSEQEKHIVEGKYVNWTWCMCAESVTIITHFLVRLSLYPQSAVRKWTNSVYQANTLPSHAVSSEERQRRVQHCPALLTQDLPQLKL